MSTSTVVDSIARQTREVILRAVADTVGGATGATPADVAAATVQATKLLDAPETARQREYRAITYVVPDIVPYSVSDIPSLSVVVSRRTSDDTIAAMVAKIKNVAGQFGYSAALEVSRRIASVVYPADMVKMAEHEGIASFGFGEAMTAPTTSPSLYAVERVPSAAYFGSHVAQRLMYGWGTYDLHIMQGVAPKGDQMITLAFGLQPAAAAGVQKLVARLVLWLLTRKGSDLVDPNYGSTLMSQIYGDNAVQARINVSQALSDAVYQWRRAEAGGLPADEQLVAIRLLSLVASAGVLVLRIKIVTRAGDEVQAVLPLSEPEVGYGH